ncbi:MAG TPA: IPTL-CTERM sorting domain-containing protein [Thermoanaerobaculia bacterium]
MARRLFSLIVLLGTVPLFAASASLTIEPITWNVIGLDSNDVASGPNRFPIGARVCSTVATTNVLVEFEWDTPNSFVDLRPGSLDAVTIASIPAGGCADAYFEVEIDKDPAAFDTTRRYHITATDASGNVSTTTPREVYVEHLISQSRNAVTDVKYGLDPLNLESVAPGGAMSLVVGNTYTIQLLGGTATQGYNQFEAFINFPNTIFQILDVETSYSANDSPNVGGPAPALHDQLYADACGWDNDPNSPTYRECVGGDFKSGGQDVVTTYTIKIVAGGGTSEALTTLLYDFSGSSYHYNADFGTGARIAHIIDPASATISKSFNPNPAQVDGVAVLTFTLTNPNGGTLGGYNFVDNLPANLEVASTPAVSTSGCGTPTVSATAGSGTISFSNGTLAANSNCVFTVNVTPTATGTFNNTTENLFVGTIDTGDDASASLTVNTDTPGAGICGTTLAQWLFASGFNTASPAPTVANVTASASPGAGITSQTGTADNTGSPAGTISWRSNGGIATSATLDTINNDYFEFAIDTTGLISVSMSFDAFRTNNGARGIAVFSSTSATPPGTQAFDAGSNALPAATTWVNFSHTFTTGLNPSGPTFFRIYGYAANNTAPGADLSIDNVLFTACATAIDPILSKSFSPDPIAVNGTSTLTFTLTNSNSVQLTGAKFTDSLPTGVQVAATPAASTTCGGSPSWAPTAGATTLNFGQTTGATIPANGSCTVTVNVTATTAGPHGNVSGFLVTTESGTASDSVATDTLTAVLPPVIAKQFAPSPVLPGGTSTLTFTLSNPNQDNALSGVAFSDTFPVAPGAMKVAPVPNASISGCGAPTFSPSAGSGSISFSGGTIAAGGTCTVTVDVTAPTAGTYNNTSGNVSHVVNAATVNGNTASDSLQVNPPNPGIALLKQVGTSATGPWSSFAAVSAGDSVHYRFTVENTGDVPLDSVEIEDDKLSVATCNASFSGVTLPVADANDDDHIVTCVTGPVLVTLEEQVNTATAEAMFGATPVTSGPSSATYATTELTLVKSSTDTFTSAGDQIDYTYQVSNSGVAPLEGPVAVTDDKIASVSCAAVTTAGDSDNFLETGEAVTCTGAYLATAADVTVGFVTNTATATADGVTSNSDSETVFSTSSADVSLTKTLTTAGPYTVGDTVTFNIVVRNDGPSTATNIQVTDVDTNLTITGVSGSGCAALPCTIAALSDDAETTISVTATIDAAGAFENEATADGDQPDPTPGNNTGSDGNTADASADVSLTKTLTTTGPFEAGDTVTFNIVVRNDGPSTATNVQVTDVDTNLTITGVSGSGCAALPCTIAALSDDAETTISVTATIDAAGAFENEATADGDQPDPTPGNNTDDDGDTADSADVSLTKTLTTTGPFEAGDTVTFNIVVRNDGPSTATNIQVTDVDTNLTITGVSGSGCAALPCTIAALSDDAETTITVTATIDAAGAFSNEATADGDQPDPTPGNNTDDDGDTADSADVSLTKTLTTTGPFEAGDTVTFNIVVRNDGPSTATNVQVTDVDTNLTITGVSGSGCAALPCTIAALADDAETTITVTATIDAAGAFSNEATADGDQPDPTPGNNTDDDGDTAVSADVSLTKTLTTAGPYTVGDTVTFDIVVRNDGPSTATNIQVTDVDTNLTITGVSGSGCAALPCTIAALSDDTETTISVTATIDAAGAFSNEATADGDQPDPTPGNNTDDDGDTADSADVSLTKTLTTTGPFEAGDTVTFNIVVRNDGPSTATNIQVTDVDTNLTITGVSGSGCAALPCTIAALSDDTETTISVTATIDAAGAFENEATADGDQPDPTPGNNTDDDGGTADSADVSLTKTLTTTGPFEAGDTVTFDIVVRNDGPSTATNIQVTDVDTNLTITGVSGSGCAALPCTIAALSDDTETTISVTATIDAAGPFENEATADGDQPDPTPGNNTDDDGDTAVSADVSLTKTLTTAGPYTVGDTVTFNIVVRNDGPSTATNIQVTDVDTNLTITGVSGSGCAALPCTIAALSDDADTTITVTATIDAAGAFENEATADGDQPDPTPGNNTDDDGDIAGPSADVSVVKTLTTAGPHSVGDTVSFSILVANAGPSPATSIDVTDTPANFTITSVAGSGCTALPCTIPTLAVNANTTVTVTGTIGADGLFENSATATADEPDPDPDDNTDDDTGIAGPFADVSVVKTLTTAGPYSVGDEVTFSILVANDGLSSATNVEVTDTPSNFTIATVSGSGCAALPCTIASIAAGADTTITVTGTIDADGVFGNTATATADEPDPDVDNNTDDDTGIAGPFADVSVVKTLTTAGPFTTGDTVNFTIVVSNAGLSTATNVEVTDTDTNLTITSVSGSGCAALPCTIPSLAMGASTTINVTATIDAAGAFSNTATATADEPDPDVDDNTDDDGGIAGPSADVSLVKTLITAAPFTVGQSIQYTLVVSNAGPSTATSVEVTDVPANMTITSVSGSGCAALPCTIPSIAMGASATINVTATVNAAGAFSNTATATADEPDPDVDDNTDDDGDIAGPSADVSLVKTLITAGPFSIGQAIQYTLVMANAGPSTATSVAVTDVPANMTITAVSGSGCAALPCTIPSIAMGASATINVTATVNAAGAFSNTATATADEPDPDVDDNTDDDGDIAGPSADVSLVKTLITAGPFIPGQSIQYTLVVANAGPSVATKVEVTDTPSNMTITSVSGSGCAALPCTIPSIAMGANATINVTATLNAAGAFSNTATATATEPDPDVDDNTDDDGDIAGPSADVSLVKTLITAGPFSVGQSIQYTLVVANAGPSTATSVEVTDTPSNMTVTAVSGSGCAALPCTIPSIAMGASATVNVTATVNAAGAFSNTATATANEPDPDVDDNTDDDGDIAGPSADVSLVKTLITAGPFSIGQAIQYTLIVANAGPSTATSVTVTDTPANMTITGVSGSGCAALPCTIPSIAMGANATINVTATVNAAGAFSNTATATATEPDPDVDDNTDDDGDIAGPSADVSLVKTLITVGPFSIGQSIQYTLVVANAGPSAATNIQVTDTPTNLTITGVSGSGCAALPCTIASLAMGASTTITVTATIDAAGAFDNVAAATATEPDPDGEDNDDEDDNGGFTGPSADVSVVKTLVTPGPFGLGQELTYTLVVANAGPSPATNIQVTDTPTNLTITGVSGSGCAALPCTIASLAVGASTTITVTATIDAAGAFDNVATVTATEPDPDVDDNTDDDGNGGDAGGPVVDLGIVKSASLTSMLVGDTFNFTLVVTNNGPDTATNVVLNDPLPANFQLTGVTSTLGTCSGTTTVTCALGTMLNGASITITMTGRAMGVGTMMNVATVDSDESEAVTSNNSSSASVVVASAHVAAVPTASEWGLMILAGLLAAAAVTRMRLS